MNNYLRPIDNRFQINNISMPKPHEVKVNIKWMNKDAETDVNTGDTILNPVARKVETTWKYKLLRDDQYRIVYNQVFQRNKNNFGGKSFKSWNPNTDNTISYITYEPDNFQQPAVNAVQADGHRYYTDVEFTFTSQKAGSIIW